VIVIVIATLWRLTNSISTDGRGGHMVSTVLKVLLDEAGTDVNVDLYQR
jgi:hypothetical protein